VADLDLRPERRDQLAVGLRAELEGLMPGSSTTLRGSLAAQTADPYSDIDLCWVVADETFPAAVSAVAKLPSVPAVRLDPGLACSDRRRLVFARLTGMPLFWRVDLDVRQTSLHPDDLVIDTSAVGPEEAVRVILQALRLPARDLAGQQLPGSRRPGASAAAPR
jgi:hypothetical protein